MSKSYYHLTALVCVWVLFALTNSARAQVPIESDFSSGDDGWTTVTVSGVLSSLAVCGSLGGPFTPDWLASGGDPGGHISETDTSPSSTFFFQAPSAYLGDKSAYFEGELSYSIKPVVCSFTLGVFYDVAMCGGGQEIHVNLPAPTPGSWNFRSIPLDSSGEWLLAGGAPASDADILTVLGSLDRLLICGDQCNGTDTDALDSVILDPGIVEICDNGIDDDLDGLIDCDDPDCSTDLACIESDCSDGIDNDGDGLIDCDDPDCSASLDCLLPGSIASDFSSGDEGWTTVTISGVLSSLAVCDPYGGPNTPDWLASGGDPGGYISETDASFTSTVFFRAPGAYLGDKSVLFGGELSFSLKPVVCSGVLGVFYDVALCGGGQEVHVDLPPPTPGVWNYRSIALDSSGGWLLAGGIPASDADLQTVLGSLDRLLICGDHCNGTDTDAIDSVVISAIVPPLSLSLDSDCASGDVTLQWTGLGSYDSIEVRRDGGLIATLPGSVDSLVDPMLAPGVYEYEVTAYLDVDSTTASLTLNHCPDVSISEVRIDQPSSDTDEYFELQGTVGQSLEGLTYVVIGDGSGGSGVVENVTALTGTIPASGVFVVAEGSFSIGFEDQTATLNFENSDNVTHLLVTGFTGEMSDDLDIDDDGTLDSTPWADIVDEIALVEDLGTGEQVYSSVQLGPVGTFVPGHALRCGADWGIGPFDPAIGVDSPGDVNVCPDCDSSGTPDPVEVATGSVADCNGNAIPDSCELADGTELDCNMNDIPDSCDIADGTELDCNGNGIPDSCDLASGSELDCNGNGIPDSCDIVSAFDPDCNGNEIPDSCDIADGTELDCNANGVPDSCDIASAFDPDCNGNEIPDSCDIASGTSLDTLGDGIPDECQEQPFVRGDSNADGLFDIGDAITTLDHLFAGGPLSCDNAADANDDELVDIGDAIFTLSALFASGPLPSAPHPACGLDPTPGGLECASFTPCP